MERLSVEVAHFTSGCEYLLSALARHTQFSDTEKQLILYYYQEIAAHAQSLGAGYENQEHREPFLSEDDTFYIAGHG